MKATLPILAFHRVLQQQSLFRPNEMYLDRFDKLIRILKKQFLILPLSEAILRFYKTERPNLLAITFDDGYHNNFEVALPILLKHGVKATFFVASGFLDGGWMWNDGIIKGIEQTDKKEINLTGFRLGNFVFDTLVEKNTAINMILSQTKYRPVKERNIIADSVLNQCGVTMPDNLMMNEAQVKQLYESGMEIGGHTVNHPILKGLEYETALSEISKNKTFLEALIGTTLTSFAFPNGSPGIDYDKTTIQILKSAGYKYAVTTESDLFTKKTDAFQIPRFSPWDKNPLKYSFRIWFKKAVSCV